MKSLSLSRHAPRPRTTTATLTVWLHRFTTRRSLAKLDKIACRDIGLTSAQAQAEAAKPFWKA